MKSMAPKLFNLLRVSPIRTPSSSLVMSLQEGSRAFSSSGSESGNENDNDKEATGGFGERLDVEDDDTFPPKRPEMEMQGVNPGQGWNFRGVHRAVICGKIGTPPVQKILRNGRTVTTFTVGTGGMFDQRLVGSNVDAKPVQWHRIAVHNPMLGAYAVQQLVKNSSVYVEGDIETRVYNDGINGEVKTIPEICVRHDGRLRLVKGHESATESISIEELKQGLQGLQG